MERRRTWGRVAPVARVTLAVVAIYLMWIAAYLGAGGDVRDFIHIGKDWIAQGHGRSAAIHLDPGYTPPVNQNPALRGNGYDGENSYYIALDPRLARYYMDNASYRYSRILYPMLVRTVSLGDRHVLPWALVLINVLAVAGGTLALAIWLRRRGASPYWALIYGLWPGMAIAVQRDLTEPLAYGLAAAGILAMDGRSRSRFVAAGLLFGLAGLARQTTLIFPLIYALWIALGRAEDRDGEPMTTGVRRRSIASLLTLSIVPLAAYLIFLRLWLGYSSNGGNLTAIPFGGMLRGPYRLNWQGLDFATVVVPALVATAVLAPWLGSRSRERWLPWLLMLGNVLLNLVFFAQFYSSPYTAIGRQAIGLALSGVMCVPYLKGISVRRLRVLGGATGVGMLMLPVVLVYGFTNVTA